MAGEERSRLLDEGGPPATVAGLAFVVGRRHRLARRRLQALTGAAVAVAGSLVGLVAAGGSGGGHLAASPTPGAVAATGQAEGASASARASAPATRVGQGPVASAPVAAGPPAAGPHAAPVGSSLRLAFLARAGGASVRAYVQTLPRATGALPVDTSCWPSEALVLEVADRRAVGQVHLASPPAGAGFVAATTAVLGVAEGAPFEVAAARAPAGSVVVTARFAQGARSPAILRDGWVVAVDPLVAPGGVEVQIAAAGQGGRSLGSVRLSPDATSWRPRPCALAGGRHG